MQAIHYIAYDRFPAPKGAAVHIRAFVEALQDEYGGVRLSTVANTPGSSVQGNGRLGENSFLTSPSWQNVEHVPIQVSGKNLLHRVAGFRKSLLVDWRFADIVHVRSIYEGYPLARDKAARCRRLVFEVNGLPSIELKYHYPEVADDLELLTKLRFQEQTCLDAADLVLTVSQTNAEHLVGRGVHPDKIRVIPNGVDERLFSFSQPQQVQDALRMLYVGTLSSWQGIRVAVEALALYCRDYPATLTVIGDGRKRQRESLWKQAEALGVVDRVEIIDGLDQAELVRHYHDSHCAVAPLLANDRNQTQGCCPLKGAGGHGLRHAADCQRHGGDPLPGAKRCGCVASPTGIRQGHERCHVENPRGFRFGQTFVCIRASSDQTEFHLAACASQVNSGL